MSTDRSPTPPAAATEVARRRPRWAPIAVVPLVIVAGGLITAFAVADPDRSESASTFLLGQAAPTATGELADGGVFDLARRKGDWVVLNFFQSSCVPCQLEHPALVEFEQRQHDRGGARLYTIVYDDTRENVERFFAERGGDWPIVYDDDGSIAVAFGISRVPETWIIDPTGVVRSRIISQVSADFLEQQLRHLQTGS